MKPRAWIRLLIPVVVVVALPSTASAGRGDGKPDPSTFAHDWSHAIEAGDVEMFQRWSAFPLGPVLHVSNANKKAAARVACAATPSQEGLEKLRTCLRNDKGVWEGVRRLPHADGYGYFTIHPAVAKTKYFARAARIFKALGPDDIVLEQVMPEIPGVGGWAFLFVMRPTPEGFGVAMFAIATGVKD